MLSVISDFSLSERSRKALESGFDNIDFYPCLYIYTLIVFFCFLFFHGRECAREYGGLCVTLFVRIQTCFRGIFYSKKEVGCLHFTIVRKESVRYFLAHIFYKKTFFFSLLHSLFYSVGKYFFLSNYFVISY